MSVTIHAQPYGLYDAGHLENGLFVAGPHMDNIVDPLQINPNQFTVSKSGFTAKKPL